MKSKSLAFLIGIGLVLIVGFCFYQITQPNLTTKESLLFSLLLTIASVIGSGIITKYYADFSARDNLRFFALKAAEKVTNLSNELNKLAVYLHEELETSANDYNTLNEALQAKELKIEFAIQMINTLKSVNDKSLSDWQGVIGEEISAKEEEQEESEERLRDVIDKLEHLHSEIQNSPVPDETSSKDSFTDELELIKKEVRGLAAQVSGVPFTRSVSAKPKKQSVEKACPKCSSLLKYRQRPSSGGLKRVRCPACKVSLVSQFKDGIFVVEKMEPISEEFNCPICQTGLTVLLDPTSGSTANTSCSKCQASLRVTRAGNRIGVRAASLGQAAATPLDEALLEKVRKLMPSQPWPKGSGKAVANQLGVPNHVVARAIQELIKRGIYKVQIEGQLYRPVE
jgi:hypothetical protein